jgi:hypothetical protein
MLVGGLDASEGCGTGKLSSKVVPSILLMNLLLDCMLFYMLPFVMSFNTGCAVKPHQSPNKDVAQAPPHRRRRQPSMTNINFNAQQQPLPDDTTSYQASHSFSYMHISDIS